jgi:hypothetical protein
MLTTASNDNITVNNELERTWLEADQDTESSSRDLNPGLPEYEAQFS